MAGSGAEEPLDAHITALYAILVVMLVLGAGLMSGLTLGLLSLDVMDLEVRGALLQGATRIHMLCMHHTCSLASP